MAKYDVEVRVGQLWRRRRDGKAFIPAHHVGNGWFNKAGTRRTAGELRDKYNLVRIDDAPPDLRAVK